MESGTDSVTVVADATVETSGVMTGEIASIDPSGFEAATGWHLEEPGLCRGDVCIPTGRSVLTGEGRIDLVAASALLDRPLAMDRATRTVVVGVQRTQRSRALTDLVAPDFSLPDLSGALHRFEDWQDRKRLLVAFASW